MDDQGAHALAVHTGHDERIRDVEGDGCRERPHKRRKPSKALGVHGLTAALLVAAGLVLALMTPYVLAGELTISTPGEQVTLLPGDYLLAPRGVPHTYRVGAQPARWLTTSLPAGFERFVVAVSELTAPDTEQLARIAAEHEIEILGPPGMLP